MTTVSQIMTHQVHSTGPQDSLQSAARWMRDLDVGSLPVCNGRRVLGMVTDRDITVRGTAAGLVAAQACVSDVMTLGVQWCLGDQDIADVLNRMGQAQVRRLPVVDADEELIGIVSMADLATRVQADLDRAMREISMPSQVDDRPGQDVRP